ncbi:unnamed protein product [Candidula unifasciata]|uniref:U5 small nuclear ribonucleoprotein TSSC4 n=1 Tax=Candidula unifasciata TaxID=100452 RepID=A0A8S3YVB9_9EUPU|nr:unnamed protein product [Candidula unifasciata]
MEEEAANFIIKSGTDLFVSRSRDVFASLGALEDKHSAFLKATAQTREKDDADLLKHDPDEDNEIMNQSNNRISDSAKTQLSQTRDVDYERRPHSRSPRREKSSGAEDKNQTVQFKFKRPARPPQKFRRQPVPDFRKHPEKYTEYSLDDVSENDMSERTNQTAAFEFLVERKLEREKQERLLAGLPEEEMKFDSSEAACSHGKITFSRPKQQMKSVASDKSVNKDEISTLLPAEDPADNVDEDTKGADGTDVTDEDASDRNVTESKASSSSFKSRKNVKRHIRTKDCDADSD